MGLRGLHALGAFAFALALIGTAFAQSFPRTRDLVPVLSQWVGRSPMTQIEGRNFFQAAGFSHALHASESTSVTRWGAVTRTGGGLWTERGFIVFVCSRVCPSVAQADGVYFISISDARLWLYNVSYSTDMRRNQYCMLLSNNEWRCQNFTGRPVVFTREQSEPSEFAYYLTNMARHGLPHPPEIQSQRCPGNGVWRSTSGSGGYCYYPGQ